MNKSYRLMCYIFCSLFFFCSGNNCLAGENKKPLVELLSQKGAPGSIGNKDSDKPDITVFLPASDKATGTGVIICPGGAYTHLEPTYEGSDVALWLNKLGVAAFVLKYRLTPGYHLPIPLYDALRAIRYVRFNKDKYRLKSGQIGILGFSAGGHVASTVATHFNEGSRNALDPIDAVSSRPDFAILGYPIITFLSPYAFEPCVRRQLGDNASEKARKEFSNELHVTATTPPAFLFHSGRDIGVPPENSIMFYTALRKMHIPAELHVYDQGAHGTGMANGVGKAVNMPLFATWTMLAENWLKGKGLLQRHVTVENNNHARKSH